MSRNFDRACRKYEEAFSIFRYYYSTNPKWSEQGIDDSELQEVDYLGTNEFEKREVKKMKLQTLLNIASCNIKTKDYESGVEACKEALKLDPSNLKALYRKARAIALPINSGVEEFKKALVLLKRVNEIDGNLNHVKKEILRLTKLIGI